MQLEIIWEQNNTYCKLRGQSDRGKNTPHSMRARPILLSWTSGHGWMVQATHEILMIFSVVPLGNPIKKWRQILYVQMLIIKRKIKPIWTQMFLSFWIRSNYALKKLAQCLPLLLDALSWDAQLGIVHHPTHLFSDISVLTLPDFTHRLLQSRSGDWEGYDKTSSQTLFLLILPYVFLHSRIHPQCIFF